MGDLVGALKRDVCTVTLACGHGMPLRTRPIVVSLLGVDVGD